MTTTEQKLREAFNRWFFAANSSHCASTEDAAWEAWQEASALAQPAEGGEAAPTWWMRETDEGAEWTDTAPLVLSGWTPLYTAPQPAQATQAEVTDAEIVAVMRDGNNCNYNDEAEHIQFARAALSQQPATPEPVVSRNPFASRCYTMSESHLSGHRLIVGFENLVDAQDAHEWVTRQGRGDFTHPAPGVPDDVVRDAERYRWLRENGIMGFTGATGWLVTVAFAVMDAHAQTLDSNIDAAMLAAKNTK